MRHLLVLAAIAHASATAAMADPVRDAASAVVECRGEADTQKRLACLDNAAAQMQDALSAPALAQPAQPTPPAAPPQQTAQAESSPTWARAPDIPENVTRESEPSEIEVTIVKASESFGRYTFVTSDGQVWRQTQPDRVRMPRNLPTTATIKRRITGNPMIHFPNLSRGYRVERIS